MKLSFHLDISQDQILIIFVSMLQALPLAATAALIDRMYIVMSVE